MTEENKQAGRGNLSPDFKRLLGEIAQRSQLQLMVDAMLEEDPTLDPEKAFEEAQKLLGGQRSKNVPEKGLDKK